MPAKHLLPKVAGRRPGPDGRVLSFAPGFDRDFVERLLGRRRRQKLSNSTARRITIQEAEIPGLLKPRLVQQLVQPVALDGKLRLGEELLLKNPKLVRALQGAVAISCFVATVGPALDRRIDKLQQQGRLANAAVLDALGSGAVESVADQFQKQVAAEYQAQGLVVGPRFSPGYCDWPLTDQPGLFSLLDHEQIGVELDHACLMQPRKSISAIFGLYPAAKAPADRELIPCRRCNKQNCIARR
ncbi:vitamin B12 dependent-methionine synthase activation domain-containing protein [Desulfurivibrio sp. D14AmB]|uniref:vitamin B12 dependent-methionine synthase activation domain-containing protein n=1 Tax=Desulfurivibrio sp. D14AmB TaxID=3374370 RepID=UPI00376ED764